MVDQRWLDDEQAALYLGTTVRHLRNLREQRAIPYSKVGKFCRYDIRELDRWMKARSVRAS
jgi:excisionase family DNA binding protein